MKKITLVFFLSFGIFAFSQENCGDVIDLGTLTSPYSGDTSGATNDFGQDCLTNTGAPDQVFSIEVPDGQQLTIGQSANGYDSKHRVAYGATCPGDQLIDCIDDPDTTTVVWENTTGSTQTVYWIQSAFSTGSGSFTLEWNVDVPPSPPANDECADAVALTVNPDNLCGTVTSGTIAAATDSGVDTCGGTPDDDVWYSFVATSDTHIVQLNNIANGTTDLYHAVYDATPGCGSLANAITCSDPNTSTTSGLVIGNTYYVQVFSWTGTANQTSTFDICIGTPPGAPANDECADAVALTVNPDDACGSVTAGTIASATDSGIDTCFGTPDDDVWYSFVATNQSHIVSLINIAGGTTDLYHAVYDAAPGCGALADAITCSDPNTSTTSGLVIGNTYYVQVFSWTSTPNQTSTFDICVGTPPPPPANDDFANAAAVVCDDVVAGSTSLATLDEDDAPDGGGADLDAPNTWYSYDSSSEGAADVTVSLCGSSYDTSILVYTGTSGNLTFVAGNDDFCGLQSETTFAADGTQTYYITVTGFSAASTGDYTLSVTCAATTPPPANDECANAEELSIGVQVSGTTVGATQNGGEEQPTCDLFGAIADVWYSVTTTDVGDLTITTAITGTSDQANVAVYTACGGLQADQIACSDDNGGETVVINDIAAGTYYIRVWSDGAAPRQAQLTEGTFDITADFALSNDEFENPTAFSYYPNPVKNTLTLNAQNTIEQVVVFNMLGQEVLRAKPNGLDTELNMSDLTSGAYFVRVVIGDSTKTIRVIKQ